MPYLTITKDNFDSEVLASPVPVLVDFWASWCGPCRMMAPTVEALGDELSPSVAKVAKINVDDESDLAAQFGIMSIPTLIVFRDGKVAAQSVGVRDKAAILAMMGL